MNIGCSPLSGKIFAGKSRKAGNSCAKQWVGKKHDVTEEAINAVAQKMEQELEDGESSRTYTWEGFGTLRFKREW
jgi:hypothetical protein